MKISIIGILLSMVIQISLSAQNNWTLELSQTNKTLRSVVAVDSNIVWAAGDSGIVVNTFNGGDTWSIKSLPDKNLSIEGIDAYNQYTAWVVTYNFSNSETALYKTSDGGENWALKHSSNKTEAWYNDVKFFDENNGLFYGDPEDGYFAIFTTQDGGENWIRVESAETLAPITSGEYGVVNNMAIFSNSAWFGTQNDPGENVRLFYSNDQGSSWNFIVLEEEHISAINSISFFNESIGAFVSSSYFGKTDDGGLTWSINHTNFLNTRGISFATSSSIVAVAPFMGGGYYSEANLSIDGGNTWQEIQTNITDKPYDVSFVNSSTGWAVGTDGIIMKWTGGELPDNPTSIESKTNIVNDFALHQNYPNPFNPTTIISYTIAKDDFINLELFDVLGRKVKTLVNTYKKIGAYNYELNMTDIPSGVYVYKLSSDNIVMTRKLVYLK